MAAVRATAVVLLLLTLAMYAGAAAQTPGPTPTPVAAPQPAIFGGSVWVDAHRVADRDVTAKIGDTVCATNRAPLVTPPGGGGATYGVAVPPDEVLPGCGREGALVTFFVGDQQAAQMVEWHAGEDLRVDLIVGAPFAYFEFTGVTAQIEQMIRTGNAEIVPLVGNKPCGYGNVVYSNEQESGCGVEGSQVTFELVDAQGNVVAVAREKGVWHAWDGISFQWFDLTFGPAGGITMPGTGTGDASGGEGSAWGTLSVLLGFAGLTGAALGRALRKQAMTARRLYRGRQGSAGQRRAVCCRLAASAHVPMRMGGIARYPAPCSRLLLALIATSR